MTTLHAIRTTPDPTPEDTLYRARCEREFGLQPDPAEHNRYPAGYWKQCYAYWKSQQVTEK